MLLHYVRRVSLDPLQESSPRRDIIKFYGEESEKWTKEKKTNPYIVFPPGNRQAQEVFYQTIDGICSTFASVKDDWRACVTFHRPIVFPVLTVPQAPPHVLPPRKVLLQSLSSGNQFPP